MSESDSAGEFGSAKDENYKGSGNSAPESDSDEPLAKTSKSTPKKKATKSPKKKSKKEKKVVKKGRGRPPSAKKEKAGKVTFSLDPLAGADPPEKDDESEEEEEYEVRHLVASYWKNALKFKFGDVSGGSDCRTSRIQRKARLQDSLEEL